MSSVPPDDFNDGEPPDDSEDSFEEDFDRDYVAWHAESDPPDWFYNAADILGELEDRDSVFLEVQGGLGAATRDEFSGEYTLTLHAYDEDTGEDLYFEFDGWTKDDLLDFYDYIEDYYADSSFWSENYSLAGL